MHSQDAKKCDWLLLTCVLTYYWHRITKAGNRRKIPSCSVNICGIISWCCIYVIWSTSSVVKTQNCVISLAPISHPKLFSCTSSWTSEILLNLNYTLCTLFINAIWLGFLELRTLKLYDFAQDSECCRVFKTKVTSILTKHSLSE